MTNPRTFVTTNSESLDADIARLLDAVPSAEPVRERVTPSAPTQQLAHLLEDTPAQLEALLQHLTNVRDRHQEVVNGYLTRYHNQVAIQRILNRLKDDVELALKIRATSATEKGRRARIAVALGDVPTCTVCAKRIRKGARYFIDMKTPNIMYCTRCRRDHALNRSLDHRWHRHR